MLRNTGEIVDGRFRMDSERVKSVGISFLGGHSGIEGRYELGIDSIRAVNEEDACIPGKPQLSRHHKMRSTNSLAQQMILRKALGGNEVEVRSNPNTSTPCTW